MSGDSNILIPALTGGLMGAIFNVCVNAILNWFKRPNVSGEISKSTEGSIVETLEGKHIRLKINNKGKTIAKNVRVMICKIKNQCEVYDSIWSGLETSVIDIPSKSYRFCDIFLVKCSNDIYVSTISKIHAPPIKHMKIEFDVVIAADNAKTQLIKGEFEIAKDNTILELKVVNL